MALEVARTGWIQPRWFVARGCQAKIFSSAVPHWPLRMNSHLQIEGVIVVRGRRYFENVDRCDAGIAFYGSLGACKEAWQG